MKVIAWIFVLLVLAAVAYSLLRIQWILFRMLFPLITAVIGYGIGYWMGRSRRQI